MSAFAAYWPETGPFEVFGAFGAIPNLEVRGQSDEVGDRCVTMKDRTVLSVSHTTTCSPNVLHLRGWGRTWLTKALAKIGLQRIASSARAHIQDGSYLVPAGTT